MTIAEAETLLAAAKAAYTDAIAAVAAGIGDRSVTRQRIRDLGDEIARWERVVAELTAAAAGSERAGVRLARWS